MANTRSLLGWLLSSLHDKGFDCVVFGGWAEELLGLQEAWCHSDIDLLLVAENFDSLDTVTADATTAFQEIPGKRFKHKRAFLCRDVMCEIILVRESRVGLATDFWGDTRFYRHSPLAVETAIELHGTSVQVTSAQNLAKYRSERSTLRPDRWRDPASLEPRKAFE
ncbi:hypothetical protein [uncultured Roseibium sp.]|uniref:hypothetical protein n=1 Tax=uncultured Roseibium sp. TaxID=1936171 RepID=UPI002631FABA|nr:hypothetical protein [uncultured Roseibium sp.]